jgi:hypothetical protein
MAARGKYQRKLNRLYDSIIMRQQNTGESGIGTLSSSGATASAASQMIDDIIAKWPDVKIIDFDQNEQGE